MFYSKIHRQKNDILLAVCDKEAHNRTFESDKLSFFVDPKFYGNENISSKELVNLFKEANIINLAGQGCIGLAIEQGIVDKENVLSVGGLSHAQVIRI